MRLACAEEDSQGEQLEVYWDYELDRLILEDEGWNRLATQGFDSADQFGAFLHTLQWNCVTATDPTLFQSPFRAGIKVDAYQMEPLRKALRLPRVNLFIADDTGLGKTIEAGLIAQELLLRRKVKTIVVAAPPSVLEQWKAELEERFGLLFHVLDREYFLQVRRERGFGVNPWRTHSRFLVSHKLLIDDSYAAPLREWLGVLCPGSLLILDEAHHAAPSSGNRYGIESKFTRAVRDLARRFEHRLFLSATPHNGHSSSFSTLLEVLDPTRFTRGVPVQGKKDLEEVMVRRLKEDIRSHQGGFPKRRVERLVIDGLPDDTPELRLSRLLDEYRSVRERRHQQDSRRAQAAAGLLVVGLQQRLLSSIEAFARTLKVHRRTVAAQWQKIQSAPSRAHWKDSQLEAGTPLDAPDADDDRATWSDEELEANEEGLFEELSQEAEQGTSREPAARQLWQEEQRLLDEMERIAEDARYEPDVKMRRLIDWVRENQCPELPPYGESPGKAVPSWGERRVLIFTENRQGTKMRLRDVLTRAIEGTDRCDERIAVIEGPTPPEDRREIQRRFNAEPKVEPLRILIATDAAREGLNLQGHCADLFHFDLPWNPARLEQRNGRIDRKLQPADEVRCHYFALPQRVEDRVLEVLVEKTERIKKELGSLSKVIDDSLEKRLRHGIKHSEADALARALEAEDLDAERKRVAAEELETSRERQSDLKAQIERCQALLDKSRAWIDFKPDAFREALSCALRLHKAEPLKRAETPDGRTVWNFPALDRKVEGDPSWASTLDTLRAPRKPKQNTAEWRTQAPIRPVVFEDAGILTEATVHLHLQQRVAQRLLARFRSQGFIHHDLSRACLAQAADSIPRVILLGHLSLYGARAERLHEEIVPVAARWLDPERRDGPLKAYARDAETAALKLLEESLGRGVRSMAPEVRQRLLDAASRDIADLRPQLKSRADEVAERARERLHKRGEDEAASLRTTVERQRDRVREELRKHEKDPGQLMLGYAEEDRRQREEHINSWRGILTQFERDLAEEPGRIRAFYEVRATRIEPVGLVYLWPESN